MVKAISFIRSRGFILAIIIISVTLFGACKSGTNPFYDTVLNDFDSSSYFIALNLKSPYYKGRVIIENNNLYKYLNHTRGFNKEIYQTFMKRLLAHNRTLKIKDKDIEEWRFLKVRNVESVIRNAYRGKDAFIINYFTGVSLNYGVPDDERNAIVDQLFHWEVPAKIDKLANNLIIG